MVVTQASCSLGSERRCSAFLAPVTAAAGSLDHDYVAVFDLPADLGWQLFAVQKVAADLARFSAFEAARAMAPAVGEQGEACWCKDSYGADEAVATAVFSVSAGVVEEFVALDAHGVLQLEGFGRGVERVAHPDVDS